MKTSEFIATFGVNTHYATANQPYMQTALVASELNYIGIDQIRDAMPNTQGQLVRDLNLAGYGVKFDFLFRPSDSLATGLSLTQAFASANPGSTIAIEGANEIWNWPVTYNGQTGTAGALALQSDLYAGVKTSALSNVPIYDFTSWPIVGGAADFRNTHLYTYNQQPGAMFDARMQMLHQIDPNHPAVITETGAFTTPDLSVDGSVSELAQAKIVLNDLVDGVAAGFSKTFLYELNDGAIDPGGRDRDAHFGLFTATGEAKQAGIALHNFTAALSRHVFGTFTEVPLAVSTSGLPASAHVMTTQAAANSYSIVAWDEQPVWDAQAHKDLSGTPTTIDIQFGQTFAMVEIFDPLVGSAPIATYSNVAGVSVAISDHPLIVDVTGPVSSVHANLALAVPEAGGLYVGRAGQDWLQGSSGADTIRGGDGNVHLYGVGPNGGPDGADSILGGAGADYIQGNAGNDTLNGGDGSDRIFGGANDDLIYGGAGNDTVNGNLGNDTVLGGLGNDYIRGGKGDDMLSGDAGNDTLQGDLGADTMVGGPGADVFVFGPNDALATTFGTSMDTIADFTQGQDRIALGYAPAHIIQAPDNTHYTDALAAARQLLSLPANSHTVVSVQWNNDTLLFYGDGGAHTNVIDLQKVLANSLDANSFV